MMKRLARLIVTAVILSIMVFSLSGCFPEDGEGFLALTWYYTPYGIDFPELPSTVYIDEWYDHPSGYDFYAEYVDGYNFFLWSVNYNITPTKGSGLFTFLGGSDGKDYYLMIGLWSDGPDGYSGTEPFAANQEKSVSNGPIDHSPFDLTTPVKTFTTEEVSGNYNITAHYTAYAKKQE